MVKPKPYPVGKSGYRGVRYHAHSDLYSARCCNKESYHVEAIDAALAYDAMAREIFGDSAILNFPEEG